MNRFRHLPSYHYEDTIDGILKKSVGKPLRDYKIHGNSIQNGTPTPDTPIEVESVGDKTKNLISLDELLNAGSGTLVSSTGSSYGVSNLLKKTLIPNTQYTLSTVGLVGSLTGTGDTNRSLYINNADSNNAVFDGHPVTITTDDTGVVKIGLFGSRTNAKPILDKTANIRLEEGNVLNGYKIPVKVTGKNIADPKQVQRFVDGMQSLGGTGAYTKFQTDENGRQILCLYCASGYGTPNYSEVRKIFTGIFKENTRYTLSFDFYNSYSSPGDKTATNLSVYYTDGTYATNDEIFAQFPSEARVVYHYTFTSKANKTIETIQLNYNNGSTYIYMDTLQIEEGTTATEYEEYKETVTNIYLNEPLRKIGSRADYIDFETQKVIRKIKEIIPNGSENWIITSYYLSNCFNLNLKDMVSNEQGSGILLYSTHFPGSTKWLNYNQRLNIITAYRQHLGIGFTDGSGNNSVIGTTVEEFKTWLKTQYDNGKPLKIYYPLATPIEETIELPTIATQKGTTIIEVDTSIQPSAVNYEYYKGGK